MGSRRKSKKNENINGEIYGIIIISLSILIAASIYLVPTGVFGIYSREFFMGLFGVGAYVFPVIVFLIGLSLLLNKGIIKLRSRFIFLCLSIYDIVLMYHINFIYGMRKQPFFNLLKISFNNGIKCKGGGVFSEIISYPLIYILGNIGSYILLISILIILIMCITDFSISDFIQNIIAKKKLQKSEQNDKREIKIETPKDDNKQDVETAKKSFEDNIEKTDKKIKIIDFLKLNDKEKNNQENDKNDDQFAKEIDKNKNDNADLNYSFPPIDLLNESKIKVNVQDKKELLNNAKVLEDTLLSFGVEAKVIQVSRGPAVTRYELHPSPGVKVSRIVSLSDDIALNLAAPLVRIEAPIPGKAAVGIEIPNREVMPVTLREVIESKEYSEFNSKLAFALGKDIGGKCIVTDISKMPHLLIAGATGSGKSVCINSLIVSLIYKSKPTDVKMLMIDPKVVELSVYNGIPHLLIPVVTDPKKAASALYWAVNEMEQRYKLFADNNVRNIDGYNALMEKTDSCKKIPKIVIIIDELSDLMMAAPNDVEDAICRLAQMARAAGMHIVIATQRPSVDVITGVIKANIPSRISFAVSSQIDSRTILDMAGAEKLLGKGDMLFYPIGENKPIRVQGAFISEKEVERVVEYLKKSSTANYSNEIIDEIDSNASQEVSAAKDCDELLNDAIKISADYGQVSASMFQRRLKIGFNRAARLVEEMEARGLVGPQEGSKPRKLLVSKEELLSNIK